MMKTVVYDTKPYDRASLERAAGDGEIEWSFREFRLNAETALAAKGAKAPCIFVNDRADRPALEVLTSLGVKHIALRGAGFNLFQRKLIMSLTKIAQIKGRQVIDSRGNPTVESQVSLSGGALATAIVPVARAPENMKCGSFAMAKAN